MLYIFLVDTGNMLTFDMNLAMESVHQLRQAIARTCKIPAESQVLLVSGGETLDDNSLVGSYPGGTDTNPIFLFSTAHLKNEHMTPPSVSIEFESDAELLNQMEECLNLSATYATVQKRTALAQEFCELAREHSKVCEKLVLDQHLQQQGWAAVVANLEDLIASYVKRVFMMEEQFTEFLEARDRYMDLLQSYSQVLKILSETEVIPVLLHQAKQNAFFLNEETQNSNPEENLGPKEITLLEWVAATDKNYSIEQLAQDCSKHLENLNQQVWESLKQEWKNALDASSRNEMKEIKGLGERLSHLEELKYKSKKIVQEQIDLAHSFLQNQTRASNLGDASILPDLCASHKRQLQVMLKNDGTLRDMKRRIANAKNEFCLNLYQRLRWVVYVQTSLVDLDTKFFSYNEKLKYVRKQFQVIEQLHHAPSLYASACSEVVRRRAFSQTFLCWANQLSSHLLAIYNEEVSRRNEFHSQFDGHFLQSLFPGLDDQPSAFAIQPPGPFDGYLPKLQLEDLERLQSSSTSLNISIPDLNHVVSFFLNGSFNPEHPDPEFESRMIDAVSSVGLDHTKLQTSSKTKEENLPEENKEIEEDLQRNSTIQENQENPSTQETPEIANSTTITTTSTTATTTTATNTTTNEEIIRHDRGFDSETDTEDFEKVAADAQLATIEVRSPDLTAEFALQDIYLDESLPSSLADPPPPQRQLSDAKALLRLLQENLGNTRAEVERLRMISTRYGASSLVILSAIRRLLATARCLFIDQSNSLRAESAQMLETFLVASTNIQKRLENYKNELNSSKEEILSLSNELKSLNEQLSTEVLHRIEATKALEKAQNQNQILEEQLAKHETKTQNALKELEDKLRNEHRQELMGLQCRYRLMTSMERSPSDSSLEKVDFDSAALAAAVAAGHSFVSAEPELASSSREDRYMRSEAQLRLARTKAVAEKQVWFNETMRHVVEEKDKQINALRANETALLADLSNKDDMIRNFIEHSPESYNAVLALNEKIKHLELEKAKLKTQLEGALSSSVALCSEASSLAAASAISTSSRDAATSPEPSLSLEDDPALRDKLTRSTRALLQTGKVKTTTCKKRDIVLVVWDDEHHNYIVYQKSLTSPMLYFVQNYSLEALGLHITPGQTPKKLCVAAEVYDKECCIAKKAENRYRVPEGTKFYRVAVRPATL